MAEHVIKLNDAQAAAVKTALAHVFKEIFDREVKGDGAHIAAALAQLDPRQYGHYLPPRDRYGARR